MNGFVKSNMDTYNFPGKMFPIKTKTTPKHDLKKHYYLHILNVISLPSRKKDKDQSFSSKKRRRKHQKHKLYTM